VKVERKNYTTYISVPLEAKHAVQLCSFLTVVCLLSSGAHVKQCSKQCSSTASASLFPASLVNAAQTFDAYTHFL